MGLSEKTILGHYHPGTSKTVNLRILDAVELFNVSSNLRTVCDDLKNPSKRSTSVTASVQIFPFE
jgi:hypothetical protein